MATSKKWRLKITANNGYAGMTGIAEWQLRTAAGVARPFVRPSMSAAVTNTGTAVLGGAAALEQLISAYDYDEMRLLTLPFDIKVGTITTRQVVVNGYGFVSFGHNGQTYGWTSYVNGGKSIPYPFIAHGQADGSAYVAFTALYAGAENAGATYRVRMELAAGDARSTNTVWEVTFFRDDPTRIRVDFGASGFATDPSGGGDAYGIGDGVNTAYVGTFGAGVVNQGYDVVTGELAGDGVVSASAADAFNPAANSIDASLATSWIVNTTPSVGSPVYVEYEYTEAQRIVEYQVSTGSSGTTLANNPTAMAKDWSLLYWDGVAWQTADTQSQTGWTTGQTRTFTVASTTTDGWIDLLPPTLAATGNLPGPSYLGDVVLETMTVSAGTGTSTDGKLNLGDVDNAGTSGTPFLLFGTFAPPGATMAGDLVMEPLDSTTEGGWLSEPLTFAPLAVSATGTAGTVATGRANLAPMRLSGALDGPLALPEIALEATGVAGEVGTGALRLPFLAADGVALAGTMSTGDASLSLLRVDAVTGTVGLAPLLALTLAATGETGTHATGAITAERLQLAAAGAQDALPTFGDASLAPLSLAATLLPGTLGAGTVALREMTLSGTAPAPDLTEGATTLPVLAVAGAMLAGTTAAADLALPLVRVTGVLTAPPAGTDATADLALPLAQVRAASVSGAVGTGELSLPVMNAAGVSWLDTLADGDLWLRPMTMIAAAQNVPELVAQGAVTLTVMATAARLDAGTLSSGAIVFAAPQVTAAGVAEALAAGAALLPTAAVAGTLFAEGLPTDAHGAVSLRSPIISGAAAGGTMAHGAVRLPSPWTVSATAFGDASAAGDAALLTMTLTATAFGSNVAVGTVTLRPLEAAGTGVVGNTAEAALLTIPLVRVDAEGFADLVGTATVALPVLSLEASGTAGVVAPTFTGVVLNTHTRAVSTYEGLGINSLAHFGGMVLAATSTGIVALTGDTDMGNPISATVTSGVSELGSEQFKRVLAGYLGCRAGGTLALTMITDEHHEYSYTLTSPGAGRLMSTRVKFGRGVEGRYWQWKLANRDGAAFMLDDLSLDVQPLSKRIG